MEFSQSLIKVPCSPVTYGVTENYQPLILNSGPSERFPNVIPFRTPLPMTSNQKEQRMEEKMTSILYDEYEEKVRPCIDLIDSLRALGLEKDMALPAIAVIGDQSSGKSSILEALSGVSLPRGSGIVTRCPLVLKLKKLMPQQPWRGKIAYRAQEIELQSSLEVEKEINKAQDAIAGKGVGISHELISLEISSPIVPDLTLIDLPGITRVAVGNQPQDIGNQIKSLIRKYIQKQETINLVVVPSNVDIATTEALSMAREVDPSGERTLGVLTKPDLVDQSAEENVVDVIRNLTIHLRKGYMIVKCRGQKDLQDRLSLTAAIEKEKLFFEEHQHFRVLLEEKKATIPLLAERLTVELIEHIKKSLPMLIKQIKESHQNATEELRKCGTNIPEGGGERMLFLVDKIKLFNQDISALMLGEETVNNNEKRLFTKLRAEFKNWGQKLKTSSATVQKVINEEVLKYENQYRGRELPGFVNYSTFETIMKQYIQQLEDPAIDLLQLVAEIVCETFSTVAQRNFEDFSNLRRTAKNKIEELKQEQQEEAERMIRLHFKMEKIIYCQDEKYSSILQQVKGVPPEGNVTGFQTKTNSFSFHMALYTPATELAQHLNAYFKEASNRLTNYIPMMVQFFVLRSFGDHLQKEMMILLQGKDQLDWLLKEQNDTVIKRQFLKEQIGRLTLARRRLSKFLG
ncbi:interferon-induced GTP-binding protein Mx1-like [Tachyglossus aculeatus]|uniref:interferon-induced GTP-binding protein Mx1-like n=1 Tax=Tachyglossus aculeatus TaxID=9261 RepID=UPI0018F388F3|nr:interferon-induced GTP-binding protein Mx1-like [Tachyglossus aculeatus]XP_038616149.1 interferon-induced GTP-binding protein Mx1-like [Tachyglossus aculeatus]